MRLCYDQIKKDENLLMLSNNDNHTIMLTDLKRVNIKGMSKQKNNRMLAYFDLLVEDMLIYDGDFELDVEISLGADHMFMGLMLGKSYPYYNDCIFLSFDLKEKPVFTPWLHLFRRLTLLMVMTGAQR